MVFDETEIRRSLSILRPSNELFEIRIISNDGKTNFSGYFTNVDVMMENLKYLGDLSFYSIYMVLNSINPACYTRSQKDRFVRNVKNTTADGDILAYKYFFIDVDPKRPAGTSSTNEQLEKAKECANKIHTFLNALGFSRPYIGMSGNGYHLLYPIKLLNEPQTRRLLENCTKALSMLFSNEDIDIDKKVFNPSRICKLYGTKAVKGVDTEYAPHRMSKLLSEKLDTGITDQVYLEKLAAQLPQEQKPMKYNNYNPREFDLRDWLDNHGVQYRMGSWDEGDKYILDCCPFDSNHKNKDACIFRSRDGRIGFHCFHNSCADRKWQDVRMMYEPDAYEKKYQDADKTMFHNYNRHREMLKQKGEVVDIEGEPRFLTARDILNKNDEEEEFIKTGIKTIDLKMRGLMKTDVSIWSGLRGSSKSTVLSYITLNAIENGNNVGWYSGELTDKNFMRWMNQQAAGKGRVEPSKYEGYYTVPRNIREQIADWLEGHFWLYNNKYGNDYRKLITQFEEKIVEYKLDMLILDNLMSLNTRELADSKWDAQTAFVWELHTLAQKYNIHIAFVAHPRKALGFLRLDDISGSADLGNAVQEAFIVHRNNNDFKRLSKQMFQWKDDNPVYDGTNVIEIAKDRDGGNIDTFIPLYYEQESKRLKNNLYENIIYSWDKDDFSIIPDDETIVFD